MLRIGVIIGTSYWYGAKTHERGRCSILLGKVTCRRMSGRRWSKAWRNGGRRQQLRRHHHHHHHHRAPPPLAAPGGVGAAPMLPLQCGGGTGAAGAIEAVIVSVARLHVTEAVVASVLATQSPSSPPPPPPPRLCPTSTTTTAAAAATTTGGMPWCYGVGSVESSPKARAQFAVAEVLRRRLGGTDASNH